MDLVHTQLVKARAALFNFDKDLAREVILKERRVNAYELKIDRDCEDIFALYTPVAIDLRFLLAVLKINSNLERTGDIAEGIAKYVLGADKQFSTELLKQTKVTEMYEEAINMFNDTLAAFEKEDTILARSVFKKDEFLDTININANHLILDFLKEFPTDVDESLYALSIIRKLERIGDQSKNIAEEIIFYVEAKVLKHSHKI
ncbi:MAG: phosphate signaling complex protein PhoU [Ferruginibacter sp.]